MSTQAFARIESAVVGDGPFSLFQVKGTGAVVCK